MMRLICHRFVSLGTVVTLSALLFSCFEEDQPVQPHVPGNEKVHALEHSMYTDQSFFDLGSNTVAASNENNLWMLGFASGADEWHITVNSSDFWGIYRTGATEPSAIPEKPDDDEWLFDQSDGNPDSTAVGQWVVFSPEDTSYTGEIYLLGQYDGIGYKPMWMVVFTHVNGEAYRLKYARYPGNEDFSSFELIKDRAYNRMFLSFDGKARQVLIEPPRDSWDLMFSQYGTILYTNEGVPTPYFVRGVLLNPYGVVASLDTVRSFAEIEYESAGGYSYSGALDFIGHEWKDVTVDVTSGTAIYTVLTGNNYIIRDTEGYYYKLRFVSYLNDKGVRGYPLFEYMKL